MMMEAVMEEAMVEEAMVEEAMMQDAGWRKMMEEAMLERKKRWKENKLILHGRNSKHVPSNDFLRAAQPAQVVSISASVFHPHNWSCNS